jgi:hypothetical protein
MPKAMTSLYAELSTSAQREQLARWARDRRLGLALLLVGWLHLAAFSLCYALTVVWDYHDSAGYLAVWVAELAGVGLIFWLCRVPAPAAPSPLARFVVRVWFAYFVLAFNLGTLNTLRGHRLFELFPAMASLASFGFLVMTFAVNRRFFAAVLVMFTAGLLMAAYLLTAYLIFAVAWWLVLQGVGLSLLAKSRSHVAGLSAAASHSPVESASGDDQRYPPAAGALPVDSRSPSAYKLSAGERESA